VAEGAAGGAASGVGATGARTAAGATGGKGVLATATGKAALAAAGTAVVASGAFVAVQATGDDRPTRPAATAAPTAVVRVASQSQTQTVASLPIQLDNAQYVTVSGLRDTALQQRVNAALRAPVDRALRIGRQFASDPAARRACAGKPEKVRTTVETGLSGPRLLSARYDLFSDWCQSADGQPPGEVVTLDLTTGKRLTATDVFRAETLTKAGLARLKRLVPERDPQPGDMSWHERCLRDEGFTRAHLSPTVVPGNTSVSGDSPPSLSAFLTPTRFELAWFTSGSDGCHRGRFAAPYGKVRELLKPEFAALLPG
ncbi:hypothetical protein, partial [Actinomadura kijaniata]|uniref:hypothetical protein n=1 Tax=Actinomadura kijaniata TaxID=46161 RepID=UPI0031DF7A47